MKCSKCGAEVSKDSKFCSYCGERIKSGKSPFQSLRTDAPETLYNTSGEPSAKADRKDTVAPKQKFGAFWNGMDLLSKIIAIAIAVVAILLLVSIFAGKGLAIFFSILQLVGLIVAFLMHKDVIKPAQNKKWITYLVLVVSVLLTVLNIMSYSWGSASKPAAPSLNSTDIQQPNATPEPVTALTPFSAADCAGQNYTTVERAFSAAGFRNVKVEVVEDLQLSQAGDVGSIESVLIAGNSEFSNGQEFGKDDEVLIRYHAFKKCTVTMHIDFVSNLIFSKYDVALSMNGEPQGTLEHGEDRDFEFVIDPGEYTMTFESAESSSVKGEIALLVDCDMEVSYKINCHSDEVSVETLYVDRFAELAEGQIKMENAVSEYKFKNYEEVTASLRELGFINIQYSILYDIFFGWTESGEVDDVSIAGDNAFQRGDVFDSDAEIVITYHMPYDANSALPTPSADIEPESTLAMMPVDASEYIGQNCFAVQNEMIKLGFTEINLTDRVTIAPEDIDVDDVVVSVAVNGESFAAGDSFDKTGQIEIVRWKYEGPMSDFELAFVRRLSGYRLYYMFDYDTKKAVQFGTDDTYLYEGTYSGDFPSGVTIRWDHGKEKFTYNEGSAIATLTDGNGLDWEYSVCDLKSAQEVLNTRGLVYEPKIEQSNEIRSSEDDANDSARVVDDGTINNAEGRTDSDTSDNTLEPQRESQSAGNSVTVPEAEETGSNLVWVPTNGGTKYHSRSGCSSMEDPIQVSLETAKANGYQACKRCH